MHVKGSGCIRGYTIHKHLHVRSFVWCVHSMLVYRAWQRVRQTDRHTVTTRDRDRQTDRQRAYRRTHARKQSTHTNIIIVVLECHTSQNSILPQSMCIHGLWSQRMPTRLQSEAHAIIPDFWRAPTLSSALKLLQTLTSRQRSFYKPLDRSFSNPVYRSVAFHPNISYSVNWLITSCRSVSAFKFDCWESVQYKITANAEKM